MLVNALNFVFPITLNDYYYHYANMTPCNIRQYFTAVKMVIFK